MCVCVTFQSYLNTMNFDEVSLHCDNCYGTTNLNSLVSSILLHPIKFAITELHEQNSFENYISIIMITVANKNLLKAVTYLKIFAQGFCVHPTGRNCNNTCIRCSFLEQWKHQFCHGIST